MPCLLSTINPFSGSRKDPPFVKPAFGGRAFKVLVPAFEESILY